MNPAALDQRTECRSVGSAAARASPPPWSFSGFRVASSSPTP